MRTSFCILSVLAWGFWAAAGVDAQSGATKPASPARLELSMEVAASTDEGYPAALRVTVKNAGVEAVSLPMLAGGGCHPDNGVQIRKFWLRVDEKSGGGEGGGCGITDHATLLERVKNVWIRLQPGEYMTTMLKFEMPTNESGAVTTYWVEYTPPDATAPEIERLLLKGYVIPTETLKTEEQSIRVH